MSNIQKAFLAEIAANIIWGMSAPITKWSFQTLNPVDLVLIRLVVPTLILFLLFRKQLAIRTKDFPAFFLLGFFGMTLNIGLYYIGINQTSSINGPLIASSAPILLLAGAAFFLREKLSLKVVIGNIVGLSGLIYLISIPLLSNTMHATFIGNILIVGSTIAAVVATIVNKEIADRYSPITFMFWAFFIGALTFLPFYTFLHITQSNFFAAPSIQGLTYSIIFSSLIAYFLGFWSIRFLKASSIAIFAYIQPVAASFVAIPLLHEYPDSHFLFAMFLIFLGIFISEQHLSKKSFYTPHRRHLHRHK